MNQDKLDFKKIITSIIETIFINLIVYYFFFIMQANQEVYIELNPHPLIFFCSFMGLRYGKKIGLISALITSYVYINVFLSLGNELSQFFEYFYNFKNPLFFLWMSLILGTFRDNNFFKLEKANEKYNVLKDDYDKLKKDYYIIDKVQKELKHQIIGSNESIISLYDIATKLETFEIEDIFTETIGVLKRYLKVSAASIYYYDSYNNYLRLKIAYGHEYTKQSFIIDEFPCYKDALQRQNVVKWKKGYENNQPLMIAPLLKDNKVIAFISIDKMEFDVLSEYAFRLFSLITDWVNKALSKADFVEDFTRDRYIKNTILTTPEYFQKRLLIEKRRMKEFNMEFGFLQFKNKIFCISDLNSIISQSLRTVDVVSYDKDTKILSILMPATKNDDLHIIEKRILNNFGYHLEKVK